MHHLKLYVKQLEMEIFVEPVLTKRHCLKFPWATSFFEIFLLFVYIEWDLSSKKSKVIQVKHLDQATARAAILMFL